jgi:hypothetical protein
LEAVDVLEACGPRRLRPAPVCATPTASTWAATLLELLAALLAALPRKYAPSPRKTRFSQFNFTVTRVKILVRRAISDPFFDAPHSLVEIYKHLGQAELTIRFGPGNVFTRTEKVYKGVDKGLHRLRLVGMTVAACKYFRRLPAGRNIDGYGSGTEAANLQAAVMAGIAGPVPTPSETMDALRLSTEDKRSYYVERLEADVARAKKAYPHTDYHLRLASLRTAFEMYAQSADPRPVREAWFCDGLARFGTAWQGLRVKRAFHPNIPHAAASVRSYLTWTECKDAQTGECWSTAHMVDLLAGCPYARSEPHTGCRLEDPLPPGVSRSSLPPAPRLPAYFAPAQ